MSQTQARLKTLHGRYPGNYPVRQAQVELLLKQNKAKEAEKVLNQLVGDRPNDPDIWYQVAEVRGLDGNIIGLHQARGEFFALVGDYDQAIEQLDLAKRKASVNNFPLASRIDARQQEFIEEQREVKKMMR